MMAGYSWDAGTKLAFVTLTIYGIYRSVEESLLVFQQEFASFQDSRAWRVVIDGGWSYGLHGGRAHWHGVVELPADLPLRKFCKAWKDKKHPRRGYAHATLVDNAKAGDKSRLNWQQKMFQGVDVLARYIATQSAGTNLQLNSHHWRSYGIKRHRTAHLEESGSSRNAPVNGVAGAERSAATPNHSLGSRKTEGTASTPSREGKAPAAQRALDLLAQPAGDRKVPAAQPPSAPHWLAYLPDHINPPSPEQMATMTAADWEWFRRHARDGWQVIEGRKRREEAEARRREIQKASDQRWCDDWIRSGGPEKFLAQPALPERTPEERAALQKVLDDWIAEHPPPPEQEAAPPERPRPYCEDWWERPEAYEDRGC